MEISLLGLLQEMVKESGYNYAITCSKGDRGEEQSRAFVLLDLARRALRLHSPDTADQFIAATYGSDLPSDDDQIFYCSSNPSDIATLRARLDEAGIQARIVIGKPPGWS